MSIDSTYEGCVRYEYKRRLNGVIKARVPRKCMDFSTQAFCCSTMHFLHLPVKRAISSLRAAAEVDAESIVSESQVKLGTKMSELEQGAETELRMLSC